MPSVRTWGAGVCWPCEHQLGAISPIDNYARLADVAPKAQVEVVGLEAAHDYPGGLILGQVTVTQRFAPYNGAMIAAGSAPVLSQGDPGALPAGIYGVLYTYLDALGGESLPSTLDTVSIAANKEIHINAITPLPQGATIVNWYLSEAPNSGTLRLVAQNTGAAFDLNVLPASSNPTPPVVATAFQYADGRHEARAIMKYPALTDENGLIWVGVDMETGRSEWGKAVEQIEVWWSGVFLTNELTGLDARAIAQLGRLISADKLCVLGA